MTKVSILQEKAKQVTSNKNVIKALVSYFLELSWHPADYASATQAAAYDLENGDEIEFKKALKLMVTNA